MSDKETTTTSSETKFFVNSGYPCTLSGLFTFVQLLLESACVGVVGYYMDKGYSPYNPRKQALFTQLLVFAFLIGSLSIICQLLSIFVFFVKASMMTKTLNQLTKYGIALSLFIFILVAVLTIMVGVNHMGNHGQDHGPYLSPAVMGLLTSGLFLFSIFLANPTLKEDLNTEIPFFI